LTAVIKNKTPHIYLIAGEASGDFLGAQLMKALKKQNPNMQFSGVGGELMAAEGLYSLFSMNDLSVMGVMEVLPKLKLLLKRIKQTSDNIIKLNPDVVVTIDAPDFCFRVIRRVKKKSLTHSKFIHYVAPTVWAWRPKRAEKIAKFLDGLICLFDFEPPYFEKEGLSAIAAGHPMMESGLTEAQPLKIGKVGVPKLGVFFGSRQGEIKRLSPVILESLQKIINEKPEIELIIPTLPHLEKQIRDLIQAIKNPVYIYTDNAQKWSVFKACDAAIAVSGTVGLELAACGVPHVIVYKMNGLTFRILKHIVTTRFAHLANIMADREIVPEFIQGDARADDIANEVLLLLEDRATAQDQSKDFEVIRHQIGGQNHKPSDLAAEFVLKQI
jgi:lipid-A-disaccharide synthase